MTVPPCSSRPRHSSASAARTLRIAEIRLDARAVGRNDAAIFEAALAAQHAGRPERGHVAGPEPRTRTGGQQSLEQRRIHAGARAVRGQCALQRQIVIDTPAQDSGAVQVQHLVDEHLGGAEQAGGERRAAADGVDEWRTELGAGFGERAAPRLVLLVPQQQRIHDGVAEFSYADLQGTGIAHQAAGVQTDGVIHRGQRRVRRREQVVVVTRMIQQQVEDVGADIGRAQHEGHLAVHLAEHHHRMSRGAQSRHVRQQVHGDVGIAAQADFGDPTHHAPRDHVRDHVDAAVQELARHVRVICREIVGLRVRRVEQRARLEEEFDHARVGRHGAAAHGFQVFQLGIVAEDARRQRLDETFLEITRAAGLAQRQAR